MKLYQEETITDRAYKSLCTEFYDMTKPLASEEEVKFYKEKLGKKKTLEAMCGSGRLLIPLLKTGMKIDGLGYSSLDCLNSNGFFITITSPPPLKHKQPKIECDQEEV